jgi:HAD superfamily hydrolase (TIGR01549 family)
MKLIIFDVDGTLCHSKIDNKSFIEAFKKALNIEIENKDWDSYPDVTDSAITEKVIFESLRYKPSEVHINKIIDTYVDELTGHFAYDDSCFTIIPGAKEFLKALNDNSEYKVAIASGGFSKAVNYKLKKLGFDTADMSVIGSDSYKSKSEIISALIKTEENGTPFEKIIYIGDREYDYDSANTLDIDFIGVDYEKNNKLKELGVENVVNDFLPVENVMALLK